MQGRFNRPWFVPQSRDPPPSLARFDSLRPPLPPPDSPPPPPSLPCSDPPPGYYSPPSPPPSFSYRPLPSQPGFSLSAYLPPAQNQFFPRQISNPRFPTFYSPPVQDPTQIISRGSSVVLQPQARPEMRITRSRDHLFEPVSLPPSTRRRGQASGSGGRGKSTPGLQEDKGLNQVSRIQQLTIGQATQSPYVSTTEEGEIMDNSKDLVFSKKFGLEASSMAGNQGDRKSSNTTEKELTKVRHLHELISTKKIELEAFKVADSQEQDRQDQTSREGLLSRENKKKEKRRNQTCNEEKANFKPTNNIIVLDDDASSAAQGDVKDGDEPVASVFSAIQREKTQVGGGHEDQSTPAGQSKGKRQKDQMCPMEYASSSASEGEIRERKMQKLTSSGKAGLEASSVQLPDESGSISSSMLDWAWNFEETSSSDVHNNGADKEMVKVGNYLVEAKHSLTMHAILKKHGDIAKNIHSNMFQSHALHGICEIVQGLRIPLKQLSNEALARYVSIVKDAAKLGMNVGWLEQRLEEISETVDAMKELKSIRDAMEMNNAEIENLEREFEELAIEKEKRVAVIEEIEGSLKSVASEIREKKRAMKDIRLKCKNIPKRLLGGLY